ncbi:phage DNA-binding protein [Streptococcus pneumoniae]|nr:phage DNA-binding protein [Streptococcus pneumoniae]VMH14921.1 phage DNA-binding protein [Streptococcus pneumoniae]VQE46095.1 phage DNA-binding protein [Streptococcus pneumoniae]HET3111482.1 DNA-binding protein [Streptococcus pneumoniae]
MPDITHGREKVNDFLKDKGIKKTSLAIAYGFKRQEVTNILGGTTKGPRANSFILQVIEDYGIE